MRHTTTPVPALVTAVLIAGIPVAASGTAHAHTAATVPTLLFGDSVPANPTALNFLADKAAEAGLPVPATVGPGGCATDNRLADGIAAASGIPVANYSCAGASLWSGETLISDTVSDAVSTGDLTSATREVIIFAGANDTYPLLMDGVPLEEVGAAIRDSMAETVRQVHRTAPDARVKVLGYPRIADDAGEVCIINVTPGVLTPWMPDVGMPPVADIEASLQQAQIDGAADSGAEFVDLKEPSADSPMCSDHRWFAGLIDTTADPYNLPFHATDAALDRIALLAAL
ncbi:MAG: GDSL-type esterase/lipase family protein [Corynebacterium variabile]|uniref:GDSL-type esterase/lipase family protein n=1 Tax=Corynebacterium variabile TaxID=1727 RepID=UPI0028B174D9|nr:GDSL-type esterase/lipase family protein [Corynebacterium variabile]